MIDSNKRAFIVCSGGQGGIEAFKHKSGKKLRKSISISKWIAPEMVHAFGANVQPDFRTKINFSKVDVFSLGLIALFTCDRENFRKKSSKLNCNLGILNEYFEDLAKRNVLSAGFLELLRKMLMFDIEDRATIYQVWEWVRRKIIFF